MTELKRIKFSRSIWISGKEIAEIGNDADFSIFLDDAKQFITIKDRKNELNEAIVPVSNVIYAHPKRLPQPTPKKQARK